MMDMTALLQRTFDQANTLVATVRPEELTKPTPCPEWDVKALLNHMVGVNKAFTAGLHGEKLGGRPAPDLVGNDPATAYAESTKAALEAWRSPGALEKTLSMPFGEVPGQMAIGFNFADQLTHTWDLAKALGRGRDLDPELVQVCYAAVTARMGPEMRGPGRPFGPEVPCDENAPLADRLAAFLGRQP